MEKHLPYANFLNESLPNSIKHEQAIIGCMLMHMEAPNIVFEYLREDCFHNEKYKTAFIGIKQIVSENKDADILSLSQWKEKNNIQNLSHVDIAKFTDSYCYISKIEEYCKILIDYYLRRKFIINSINTYNKSQDLTLDICDLYESTHELFELTKDKIIVSQQKSMNDVIAKTMTEIRNVGNGKLLGTSTQRPELDDILSGLRRGFVYVVAGRPAMGKSILGKCFAVSTMMSNEKVGVFQLEMTAGQFLTNIWAETAKVNALDLQKNKISADDWQRINQSSDYLKDYIFIEDEITELTQIEIQIRKWVKEKNISGVIIDYVQLIELSIDIIKNHKLNSRENIVSYITRRLKKMAKKYNIWIIELSQLSREVDSRSDKRPFISDLRESGSIEQDAEVVMLLYRPEYYGFYTDESGNDLIGAVEVIVGKNRFGPAGSVFLHFNRTHITFESKSINQSNNQSENVMF